MREKLLRPQSVSLSQPLSVDRLVGSSPCARPTDELDSVAWTVQEILSLTQGALHGIPAALPRFPKLASVPGIPAAFPGKKICAYSANTLRILCAYSAHTRFRVENTLRILFSTHDIFNKTSPDKNVGTSLDNVAGAAALQVHIERRSRWTWFVLRFRCRWYLSRGFEVKQGAALSLSLVLSWLTCKLVSRHATCNRNLEYGRGLRSQKDLIVNRGVWLARLSPRLG